MSESYAAFLARKEADKAWFESIKTSMDPAEFAFRAAWRAYRGGRGAWNRYEMDELERPLLITECPGSYDEPACTVVAIEGSPPVGLFVVTQDVVYILAGGKSTKVITEYRPENAQKLRRALIALVAVWRVRKAFSDAAAAA